MLNKLFFALSFLITTNTVSAGVIEYKGYSREQASNVVKGGGLEWLRWDLTNGMSIDEALLKYSSDGWTLATNNDMSSLFNSFEFGRIGWENDEDSGIFETVHWSYFEDSPHNLFLQIFGRTYTNSCPYEGERSCNKISDMYEYVSALYGSDEDNDGLFRLVSVTDDYTYIYYSGAPITYMHEAVLTMDFYRASENVNNVGVALVRKIKIEDPQSVPVPTSFSLLIIGLLGLVFRYTRVQITG